MDAPYPTPSIALPAPSKRRRITWAEVPTLLLHWALLFLFPTALVMFAPLSWTAPELALRALDRSRETYTTQQADRRALPSVESRPAPPQGTTAAQADLEGERRRAAEALRERGLAAFRVFAVLILSCAALPAFGAPYAPSAPDPRNVIADEVRRRSWSAWAAWSAAFWLELLPLAVWWFRRRKRATRRAPAATGGDRRRHGGDAQSMAAVSANRRRARASMRPGGRRRHPRPHAQRARRSSNTHPSR